MALHIIGITTLTQPVTKSTCKTLLKTQNNRKFRYFRYMDEQFLSVAEVATMLNISTDTVRRMFSSEPGVINVGPSHGASRGYRVLRIPLGVLKRVMAAREINHPEQAGRTEQ